MDREVFHYARRDEALDALARFIGRGEDDLHERIDSLQRAGSHRLASVVLRLKISRDSGNGPWIAIQATERKRDDICAACKCSEGMTQLC